MSRAAEAIAHSTGRHPDAVDASRRARSRSITRYARTKRILDLTICLSLLPLALPLLGVCALLVKLTDRGPVFFVQDRTGRGGRRFKMFKFRTMVPNAAELKDELKAASDVDGPDFKLENDPRITAVGHLLRRTSLDEAPQIWNVLRGDMSLVGPRPTSFESDTYDLWHTERLEVEPGVTGLWQIARRGDIDFDDRVRLDIAYVRHRSLPLDISILLRTIPAVLTRRGAY
jgi:lipopolysaccharide/colanic/teichoic acid biosynthesis glycosyltransferase